MYTFILNDEQKKSLKVHDSSLYQAAADQSNLEEVESLNQVAFYLIYVVLFIRFLAKRLRNQC